MDSTAFLASYMTELRDCLDQVSLDQVQRVVTMLQRVREQDGVVYVLGNGGSAATASHLASDLGRARAGSGGRGLRAECLTDNMAAFTATANDTGYEGAFAEMLALRARPGDVVLAISGSGDSPNVIRAVEEARRRGASTVALVGFGGGELAGKVDLCVCVESRHYGAVEDLHLALGHMLAMSLAGQRRMQDPSRRPDSSL